MVLPASRSETSELSSAMENFNPAALSLSTSSRLRLSAQNARTLSAITSPMSSTARSSSLEAAMRESISPKWRARDLAVVSPTYLMPRAKSTWSNGVALDASILARKRSADRSFHPSSLRRSSLSREYRSDGFRTRPRRNICSMVASPAMTFIALRLMKWTSFPIICVGQPSAFGQKNFASPSSLTKGVPQSGHTEGNSGTTAPAGLWEISTPVILGMISPPFST